MNKTEFLNELKKYLSILEDREQEDIMEEYAQHIDMKMSAGLSEEEAIRDFGSVGELAAQILEAYHVKPEYQAVKTQRKLPDISRAGQEGKRLWSPISHFFKKTVKKMGDFGKACWKKTKAAAGWVIHILGVPFVWLGKRFKRNGVHIKEDIMAEDGQKTAYESGRNKRSSGGLLSKIGSFISGIFTVLWRCFLWCVRWGWNCVMIFAAFFGGIFCMFLLFMFAMLIVWLVQGYPLTGAALLCFGGVLCTGAFTFLCTTFLMLKTKRMGKEKAEELQ